MKKILKSVFAIAIAALTFTSCDDVPMPYDTPKENSGGTTYDGAAGTGTLADPYNVAGVLQFISTLEAGVESEEPVYIKGTIISIDEEYSTNYGNATFNITDAGTNYTFTVYRALYLGNKKFSSGDTQIKIGDEVIVYGTVLSYRGNTPETQQNKAYLYSLNGTTAGGEGGGGETGTPKGDGTLNNPYNPAGVIAYINTLGADKESENDVYIKGKVASISENYSTTQYGNATFTIVEEGAEGTTFTVYRALYLGNQKYTSGDLLKQNDEVIICGKVVNYKGNTPETSPNNSYLYSLNGKTESGGSTPTPSGNDGSYDNPYSVTGAIGIGAANKVYVKGYIVGYVEGQAYEGGVKFDANGQVQTNLLIATSPTEINPSLCMPVQLPIGDIRDGLNLVAHPDYLHKEVLLYGNIENYFRVPGLKSVTYAEINGNAIGTKPDDNGSGGGSSDGAKGSGTLDDPFNAIAAANAASSLGSGAESTDSYYIKGKISKITYAFDADHGTATFFISDDGTTNNQFQVYSTYYLGNKSWKTGDTQIQVGDDVIIYGKLMNYKGNTPETASKKSYIYSLNGVTGAKAFFAKKR